MATRWGIVSTGRISNDFTANVKCLPDEEHQVVAVAGSDIEKARKFAAILDIPKAYGTYEELAEDNDVEVVYIGVVHYLHFNVAKMMLEHGKHVLCELPLCTNAEEARNLIRIAKEKNLFLMEALFTAFLPLYAKIRDELNNGTIGKVRQVLVTSGFPIGELEAWSNPKTGGALLAIGYPALYVIMHIFGNKLPASVHINGILNNSGSDSCASCIFDYGDKGIATLSYSVLGELPNEAHIFGTKGVIKVGNPYWSAPKIYINGREYDANLRQEKYKMFYHTTAALSKQAEHVRGCLKKGLTESPVFSHNETMFLMELSDLLRTKMGIKYKD